MVESKETWGDYSKLVLKELERLNEGQEKMRSDLDYKFSEIHSKLVDIKSLEKVVNENRLWVDRVNDVWSPSQMKEAKDEIYKQKSRWVAAIAIFTFIQILVGVLVAVWKSFT